MIFWSSFSFKICILLLILGHLYAASFEDLVDKNTSDNTTNPSQVNNDQAEPLVQNSANKPDIPVDPIFFSDEDLFPEVSDTNSTEPDPIKQSPSELDSTEDSENQSEDQNALTVENEEEENEAESEYKDQGTCLEEIVEGAKVRKGTQVQYTHDAREAKNGGCYSQRQVFELAERIACIKKSKFATLNVIERPGVISPCYKAIIFFYKDVPDYTIDHSETLEQDYQQNYSLSKEISAQGPQFLVKAFIGNVTSGPQDQPGLINEKGKESESDRIEFHLIVRYYISDFFGFETETGYLGGNVVADDTKPMSYTDGWSSNAGISFIPVHTMLKEDYLQIALSAGLNYTTLKFNTEYVNFVEQHSDIEFYNASASGMGYYAGFDFRFLRDNGLLTDFGIRFSNENPQFPAGTEPFWANTLTFGIGIGFKPGL